MRQTFSTSYAKYVQLRILRLRICCFFFSVSLLRASSSSLSWQSTHAPLIRHSGGVRRRTRSGAFVPPARTTRLFIPPDHTRRTLRPFSISNTADYIAGSVYNGRDTNERYFKGHEIFRFVCRAVKCTLYCDCSCIKGVIGVM